MIIVVTIRQLSSLQKVWWNAYVAWVCLHAGLRADLSATYATTIWTYARVGCETVLRDTYATWIAQNVVSLKGIAHAGA